MKWTGEVLQASRDTVIRAFMFGCTCRSLDGRYWSRPLLRRRNWHSLELVIDKERVALWYEDILATPKGANISVDKLREDARLHEMSFVFCDSNHPQGMHILEIAAAHVANPMVVIGLFPEMSLWPAGQ